MKLNELFNLTLALVVGIGLGTIYYGGLWLTTRAIPNAKSPTLLVFSSYLVRIIVALFGFYLLAYRGWQSVVLGLMGFVVVRIVLVNRDKLATVKD